VVYELTYLTLSLSLVSLVFYTDGRSDFTRNCYVGRYRHDIGLITGIGITMFAGNSIFIAQVASQS